MDQVETLAQAIHDRWRSEAIARGEAAPTWPDLDESRRSSSRAQARQIASLLSKIGCVIAPLIDCKAIDFAFTDAEIEILAAAEHERWNSERIDDGWTLADDKNVERKQTPYLLPWRHLKQRFPDIAELDAVFIRAMPAILASAGLQIVREAPAFAPDDAD